MSAYSIKGLVAVFALNLSGAVEASHNEQAPEQPTRISIKLNAPWKKYVRGSDDDLLTAGLSLSELQSSTPPAANKQRQRAYYSNIRALLDVTTAGGFGRIYGPKNSQKITGVEYIITSAPKDNVSPANVAIQIPDRFNTKQPCVIVSPSSGSRDIYGAVGITGFWALPKGCVVAYTNKGTGTGFYFVELEKSFNAEGELVATSPSNQWVNNKHKPDTNDKLWVASRHAHSGFNLQKDWGDHTLMAAQLALDAMTDHFNRPYTRANTLIIAAGISNGGAAVIQAAEQDDFGLLDGIVAGEPNVSVSLEKLTLEENKTRQNITLIHTYKSFILQGLLTPCANLTQLSDDNAMAMLRFQAEQACEQLLKTGIVKGKNIEELARNAQNRLVEAGINLPSLSLGAIYTNMGLWPALNATYASSYARLKLFEDPCGGAFELPRHSPLSTTTLDQVGNIWALSNGIPPTAGVMVSQFKNIRQQSPALKDFNQSFATQLCYFAWANPSYRKSFGLEKLLNDSAINKLNQGLLETQVTGNLKNIPTLVIHGQADRLIPVNLTSRPYYWKNKTQFGATSKLSYIEVTRAQHFDALLAYPPFDTSLTPLHPYFELALDALWDHLINGKALPTSGVVKPPLRQTINGEVEPFTPQHLVSIYEVTSPIVVDNNALKIP